MLTLRFTFNTYAIEYRECACIRRDTKYKEKIRWKNCERRTPLILADAATGNILHRLYRRRGHPLRLCRRQTPAQGRQPAVQNLKGFGATEYMASTEQFGVDGSPHNGRLQRNLRISCLRDAHVAMQCYYGPPRTAFLRTVGRNRRNTGHDGGTYGERRTTMMLVSVT